MTREQWWAMIRREWINRRFAEEIESYFEEYPSAAMIEALFSSDWGREVREHFSIDELRASEEERAYIRQFIQGGIDPQSVMDIERVRPNTDT